MTTPEKKLPNGWQWVKLGDVCEIFSGSTPSSSVVEYWNGDITWITPTDLGQLKDKYINNSLRKITKAGYDSCSTTMVTAGSVVMSSRAPIGHLGIANVPLCVNQGCKVFVPYKNVNTEFLYYDLLTRIEDIKALGSGATFQEVSKTKLSLLEIPLPPLAEQLRIVVALEAQMAVAERARNAAEEMLEAVKALTENLPRKFLPLGQKLPHSWQWARLGDVCDSIRGVTFKSGEVRNSVKDGFIACVTTSAVQDEIDWTSRIYIPSEALKNNNRLLEFGDILVSTANSKALVGKSCQVNNIPEDCTFGAFVTVLRPRNNVLSNWLLLTINLKNAKQYFYEMSSNTTNISNLKVSDLLDYEIPLPPLAEQQSILSALQQQMAAADRAKQAADNALNGLRELPGALLRRAFAGEV